ncbi:MAG: hypothetical protein B7Y80_18860 [Hyphomicrobium sp. 32-62-53]|nr:MAG: hypothetical protein B7Z29_17545 [Hyphomicrobium sp. 12-62-95]OYX97677.1 MAG: hypothetical protein B7Y80_18860 [Hyphomicrobium sp. 32-62-53]
MRVFMNVALNYAAWLAVALLAAQGEYGLAVVPSLVALVIHLGVMPAEKRRPELMLAAAAIPLGLGVETITMAVGATQYAEGATVGGLPPAFMIGLWAAFATLINVSLAWMKDRLWLAVLFGALASGPSYYAGSKIGALSLGEPVWQSLVTIGAVWAVAFPLLILMARRIDR